MHILKINCIDKPGIVAAVATTLSNAECNILDSAQFYCRLSGQFFMRVAFEALSHNALLRFQETFQDIVSRFDMTWMLADASVPTKTLLMVSKDDHCLNDILYRWGTGHLNIEITGVASNHDTNRSLTEDRGLNYHHLPIENGDKVAQEAQITDLIDSTGTELIILARYMQVLSDKMCSRYDGRIINIHHSFLPGFKGARPYHQAYERGVKIVGATAHFANDDLDEGPIIEQGTMRIDHSHDPKKLQILGRDNEAKVLARAIQLYSEHRIFLHGGRTVIL